MGAPRSLQVRPAAPGRTFHGPQRRRHGLARHPEPFPDLRQRQPRGPFALACLVVLCARFTGAGHANNQFSRLTGLRPAAP